MAFIVSMTKAGYTATYLRITRIDGYDEIGKRIDVWLSVYKDKAARNAGADPLIREAARLVLEGSVYDTYFGKGVTNAQTVKAQVYIAARALGLAYAGGQMDMSRVQDDFDTQSLSRRKTRALVKRKKSRSR